MIYYSLPVLTKNVPLTYQQPQVERLTIKTISKRKSQTFSR